MNRTMHTLGVAVALATAAGLNACASASAGRKDVAMPRPLMNTAVPRGRSVPSHDVVFADEIRRVPATNAYTALERTRPDFLRVRGQSSILLQPRDIDVFLNGQYAGGIDVLRSLPSDFIAKVQLVQRSQGYVLYGEQLRGDHALFITLLKYGRN